jgi:hypothetical protein
VEHSGSTTSWWGIQPTDGTRLAAKTKADHQVDGATSLEEQNCWIVFYTYAMACYILLLQGCEGLLLDLISVGWIENKNIGEEEYVVILLLGKMKGESGDHAQPLPSIPVTSSGIQVRDKLKCLLAFKKSIGQFIGPAISSDIQGRIYSSFNLWMMLLSRYLKTCLTWIEKYF